MTNEFFEITLRATMYFIPTHTEVVYRAGVKANTAVSLCGGSAKLGRQQKNKKESIIRYFQSSRIENYETPQ